MSSLRKEIKDIILNIIGFDGNGIYDYNEATDKILNLIEKRIDLVWNSDDQYIDPSEFYDKLKEMLK